LTLALFDLDNTLLDGDSDYAWGQFLATVGAVDGSRYEQANLAFYEAYKAGGLDIQAFLAFSLEPLTRYPRDQLLASRAEFVRDRIKPLIKPWVADLLGCHKSRGDTLVLVTATNSFVTAPIAEILGIQDLIATVPEERNGRFTGRVTGTPCFRDGKVARVRSWMAGRDLSWGDSCFYSDSHNDLPLLEAVNRPIAVDPDPTLLALAEQRGWEILLTDNKALTEHAE
jgi:HAD superfamily hydrolase (TIGR01490 family)